MRQLICSLLALLTLSGCTDIQIKDNKNNNLYLPKITVLQVSDIKTPLQPILPIPVSISESEINCMTRAIYYEARGESKRGKLAVGYVVYNRTLDSRYPDTVCGVITQVIYKGKKKYCQFSWYCKNGNYKLISKINNIGFTESRAVAVEILLNKTSPKYSGIIAFHIKKAHPNPPWSTHGLQKVVVIDHQIFYRYSD